MLLKKVLNYNGGTNDYYNNIKNIKKKERIDFNSLRKNIKKINNKQNNVCNFIENNKQKYVKKNNIKKINSNEYEEHDNYYIKTKNNISLPPINDKKVIIKNNNKLKSISKNKKFMPDFNEYLKYGGNFDHLNNRILDINEIKLLKEKYYQKYNDINIEYQKYTHKIEKSLKLRNKLLNMESEMANIENVLEKLNNDEVYLEVN